jgi:3,4-dihydroxy 2-butanone 4-phosphate synthase / GTP cyclohydrolase II
MTGEAAVRAAVAHLARGGVVVVADDADRENEGDLVCAAEFVTEATTAFFLRHGSGIVCTPMSDERADALGLPLMVDENTESHRTAFTVTVDHADVGSGISAADRTRTVRALADRTTRPHELRRPGHVFPLRARDGGVLTRPGHTEAATDLVSLAGLGGVAVITELVGDDGVPLAGGALHDFARRHGLPYLDVADLVRYRRRSDRLVRLTGHARLPTDHGTFEVSCFRSTLDGIEHVALTMGDLAVANAAADGVLVRVHSECVTGDLFGSHRCDCGSQLRTALGMIAAEGAGAVVYLRGHEGRGIGLGHKLQAYQLQDRGRDTVDANIELGLPVDGRDYGVGAAILAELGVDRIRLITNNPHKYTGLHDVELVGRVASRASVTPENIAYLATKRDRMGHLIELPA